MKKLKLKPQKDLNHKEKMIILIQMQKGKKCVSSFMVSNKIKIQKLKQKIEREWGISSEHQRLNYNNQELEDNDTLKDYDICNNTTIYLTKQLGLYSLFLNIKSMNIANDKSITIGVEKHDTIRNLKLQIQLFLNVKLSEQKYV